MIDMKSTIDNVVVMNIIILVSSKFQNVIYQIEDENQIIVIEKD